MSSRQSLTWNGLEGVRALVTGGAGFIGSHLVDALLDNGARVRVLDNLSTGRIENLGRWTASTSPPSVARTSPPELELIEGDIRDIEICKRCCDGVQLVFHLAALGSVPRSMADPASSVAVNVSGTTNVFAAARDAGVGKIVYASSSSVYGDSPTLPKREGEEGRPLSPYALSKVMNEELAQCFSSCFDLELVGLRYFNVFGPRQSPNGPYAAVVPRFFDAYRHDEAPTIYGDGEQSRDFTFVSDAVQANLRAALAGRLQGARVLNVAGGMRVTINRVAELVKSLVGSSLSPQHAEPRPGDVRHSLADLSRAQAELGYRPEVDLEAGLRITSEA